MQWREERWPGRAAQLFVRRVVDPPAPPVLLLHGLGVGGSIEYSLAGRPQTHLAAITPDFRAHRQSDAPDAGYAPTAYPNDLLELIGAELRPPVPVVGHSLGAL